MIDYMQELITSKYHLSVAKRMYESHKIFPDKRILTGVINELAKATSKIIRAYLSYSKRTKLDDFLRLVSKEYLNDKTTSDLMRILEVERAQKTTPVQFSKDDKIIMLVDGKYKILVISRIGEFIVSVETAIKIFPLKPRQI